MKNKLLLICISLITHSMSAQNYDDSKIPAYEVPELLVSSDGKKIESLDDWKQVRRTAVLALFEEQMYGRVPDFDYQTEIFRRPLAGQNKDAVQEEVMITLSNERGRVRLNMLLTLPKNARGPVPVFLGLNFHGNHVTAENEEVSLTSNYVINSSSLGISNHFAGENTRGKRATRWPIKMMLEKGYGLATIHCGDIDPDFEDGFKNGAHLLAAYPQPDQWGTIAAWAWGLSRALDYLETDDRVDSDRVAVIGHSRLGKAALWAGATDPRFALVISNNSGCGGAALSRRRIGETVEAINTNFPHWFCKNFHQYNGNEDDLPMDQHMLVALIAPRPVYVASATEDQWADPKGEYTSLYLAGPVYRLYDLETLTDPNSPAADDPVSSGKQGYHLRTGQHAITEYDWAQYLEFADKHLQ